MRNVLWCVCLLGGTAAASADSTRETATVRLIRDVRDGVVAVYASDGKGGSCGSGFFIHETGFILLDHPSRLPDFALLKSVASGVATTLDPLPLTGDRKEHFGLVFEGYVKLEDNGFQRLVVAADDGSRLFLDGRLVVDHDGCHPASELSGPIRIKAGLHHLRVEYFNATESASLSVRVRRPPNGRTEAIGPSQLFHDGN